MLRHYNTSILLVACAAAASIFCFPLAAQGGMPFLVQDLNQTLPAKQRGSHPLFWGELSGKVLFSAESPGEGREIFVTQGTPSSTILLKKLRQGPASAQPRFVGKTKRFLFFTADVPTSGWEIWVSDGTSSGTRVLLETGQGPASRLETTLGVSNGFLFFLVKGTKNTHQLWRSDGTLKGTQRVFTYQTNIGNPGSGISNVVHIPKGFAFFIAAKKQEILYFSNGFPQGTKAFASFPLVAGRPKGPIEIGTDGTHVFFSSFNLTYGTEPWVSDGTQAGTYQLLDINPGSVGFPLTEFKLWGGIMTFRVWNNTRFQPELWSSDGTFFGSRLLNPPGLPAYRFQTFGPNALLWVSPASTSSNPPWVYQLGKAPYPLRLPLKNLSFFQGGVRTQNGILLSLLNGSKPELWSVNPLTGKGRFIAKGHWAPYDPLVGLYTKNWTYLQSTFPPSSGFLEPYIYANDGTLGGVRLLKDLYPIKGTKSLENLDAFPIGRSSFFLGQGNSFPLSQWIWKTRGRKVLLLGRLAKSIQNPSEDNLLPSFDRSFIFLGNGTELHRLGAGAPNQSLLLQGSRGGIFRQIEPPFASLFGDKLFFGFRSIKSQAGVELYVSDGSSNGTKLLVDIERGRPSSYPSHFNTIGNRIFFSAETSSQGQEPWVSDGTQKGTHSLGDLSKGVGSSHPQASIGWDGRAWLIAQKRSQPFSLFYTDPKAGGIVGNIPFKSFANGLSRGGILAATESFLLVADPIFSGSVYAIRKNKQTYKAQRLSLDPKGLDTISLLPFKGKILILGTLASNPRRRSLWLTDGTKAGTKGIATFVRNPSSDQGLRPLGSRRALFVADGRIWTTDGSPKGTKVLVSKQIFRNPRPLRLSGGLLLFAAEDDLHGREPWAWFPGAHGLPIGQGCGGQILQTPKLLIDDPVLGKTFRASGKAAPAQSPGLLLLGIRAPQSIHLPSQTNIGCRLFLDLTQGWIPLPPFVTSAGGTWNQTFLAPKQLGLQGSTFLFQAIFPQLGSFFELSNGYELTFGS